MAQIPIFLAMHVLGAVVCLALLRGRGWLCGALGLPIGLALTAFLVQALALCGIASLTSLVVGWIAIAVVGVAACALRKVERQEWRRVALWSVCFAVGVVVLTASNFSKFTFDSHYFLMLSRAIANEGALTDRLLQELSNWAIFLPAAHVPAHFVGLEYLHSLALVVGASFLALFALVLDSAVAGQDGARKRARGLVVLMTAILGSTGMFFHHSYYIHTNLLVALYLFGFVVLFWKAEVEKDPALLPVAFVCLLAVAMARLETPAVAAIFLALSLSSSELPRKKIVVPFALFTLVMCAWYVLLARHASARPNALSAGNCYSIVAFLSALFCYWLASGMSAVRAVNRYVPLVGIALMAIGLVIAFIVKPGIMWLGLVASAQNLSDYAYWGLFWYFAALLAVLTLWMKRPPFAHAMPIGVILYLAFVLLVVYVRGEYRHAPRDSGTRMALHVAPLIIFYLSLKLVPFLSAVQTPGGQQGPAGLPLRRPG